MKVLSVFISLLCLFVTSEAIAAQCTVENAQNAEGEAFTLMTWEQVFRSYLLYRSCDDGTISESYSYSIAMLLASRWDRVGDLLKLIKTNQSFEAFVFSHVDDTMTHDQYVQIRSNMHKRCSRDAAKFCAAVDKRFAELDKLDSAG